MQTEIEFVLPQGYIDAAGQLHKQGRMRLATALDEIESVQDPRVQANAAYLPIVLLSRVIISLGTLPMITPPVIAGIFAADLAYLEDLYQRVNSAQHVTVATICPHCGKQLQVQVAPLVQSDQ
jgi:hypothetical protein